MAELAYIKLWAEFEKYFGVLGAVEVGRLILGAQEYAFHGTEPQFTGSERILWPVLKESIDKDKAYNEKQQSNGSKGGRPKKANETQQNPEKPNETQNNPTKPHIVNRKQKTENITTTTTNAGAREEPEADEALKRCIAFYEQNICAINRAVFDEIRAQLQEVEPDLICEAIRQACLCNKPSWKYIAAIISNCIKRNIRTRDAYLTAEAERRAQPTQTRAPRRKTAQEEFLEMAKVGVPGGQTADGSTFSSGNNLLAEY